MKRLTIAHLLLLVLAAGTIAWFTREGIAMHRRNFSPGEITYAVGTAAAISAGAGLVGLFILRRLKSALAGPPSTRRRGGQP